MAKEPIDVLLKAIKTAWDANSTITNTFPNVSREEIPADEVNSTLIPYVVIEHDPAVSLGWACDSQLYEITIRFKVHDRTPELCAGHLDTIIAWFGDETLQLSPSEGSVISKREGESDYDQLDPLLHVGIIEYVFQTNRPRAK